MINNNILKYIGLSLDKIPEKLCCNKPKFKIAKSFDNSNLYKVYKKIAVKDIEILISDTDRITDLKQRYTTSIPIQEYIKLNREKFEMLVDNSNLDEIKKIEEQQESFKDKIPFFIKYEKNYLWQVYYSKEDDKYFMLYPANESEAGVLFYLIKQKLENEEYKVYIPICKEEPSDDLLSIMQKSDIENYIWSLTNQWPLTYEVVDNNSKIYFTGTTKIQENFSSSYRIEIKNQDEANNLYNLLKALFFIKNETKNVYDFIPQIDKNGNLVFSFNNEIIDIENIQEFITNETAKQQNLKYKIKNEIEADNKKIEKLKAILKNQNEVYAKQQKQIIMFMDCKKSFFKKVRFFLTNSKKTLASNQTLIRKIRMASEIIEKRENNQPVKEEKIEISKLFTISDLVKTTLETKKVQNEEKALKSDIKAYQIKEENMIHKIENAQVYLNEIEQHKKSLFEFWKYTNKDNLDALQQGKTEGNEEKKSPVFVYEDDIEEFSQKIDAYQRKKLSNEECNAIFLAKYLMPAINSVVTKSDTYIIDEEYEKLKQEYKAGDKFKNIFGDIDKSTIKTLNNKKHRENYKSLYSILRFNETTTLEDFKEILKEYGNLLNEAYQKIVSIYDMPIFYSKRNKGYIIGEINPYNLLEDESVTKIYKMYTNSKVHLVYLSNIVFYDNYNKTLPLGMDESTEVLLKVGENKKIKDVNVNILVPKDLFEVEIRKIKVIIEERKI